MQLIIYDYIQTLSLIFDSSLNNNMKNFSFFLTDNNMSSTATPTPTDNTNNQTNTKNKYTVLHLNVTCAHLCPIQRNHKYQKANSNSPSHIILIQTREYSIPNESTLLSITFCLTFPTILNGHNHTFSESMFNTIGEREVLQY